MDGMPPPGLPGGGAFIPPTSPAAYPVTQVSSRSTITYKSVHKDDFQCINDEEKATKAIEDIKTEFELAGATLQDDVKPVTQVSSLSTITYKSVHKDDFQCINDEKKATEAIEIEDIKTEFELAGATLQDDVKPVTQVSSLSTITYKSVHKDDFQCINDEEKATEAIEDIKTEFELAGATLQDDVKPVTQLSSLSTITYKSVHKDDFQCINDEEKATEAIEIEDIKTEFELAGATLQDDVKLEPKPELCQENNEFFEDNIVEDDNFDDSDDEPLVAIKELKECKKDTTVTTKALATDTKKRKFDISTEPSGVIKTESVQKLLKKWNIDDGTVEMVLLSWDEVKQERQKALEILSAAQNAYKCNDCIVGFNHKFKYDNHMKKHDEKAGECICTLCKIRCRHEKALSQHLRRHRVRWRCTECLVSNSRVEAMADHVTTTHEKLQQRKCRFCAYTTDTVSKLRGHMKVHRDPIRCPVCDRAFSNRTSLQAHMIRHKGEKEFKCPKCEKQFLFKGAMETHLQTHDNTYKYCCHECDVTFKNKKSFQQHMTYSSNHIDPSKLKFECEVCYKKFPQANRLHTHNLRVHLKRSDIACPVSQCKYTCSVRAALQSHVSTVHKNAIRNYVCHVCEKAYITKRNLENHIRSHTGERPFSCALCTASFTSDAALYNHHKLLHGKTIFILNHRKRPRDVNE